MIIILLGPPGAGKGTIARILVDSKGVYQISSGDILRTEIAKKTELGLKAKTFMDKGDLVPDQLVIKLMKSYLSNLDLDCGLIFDGFPRTIDQAKEMESMLGELNLKLQCVVYIEVSDEELIRRTINRRTCTNSECQHIYSLIYNPPKTPGICDICGFELAERNDQTVDVIKHRLLTYKKQTSPLIDFYRQRNFLRSYSHPDSFKIAEMIANDFN